MTAPRRIVCKDREQFLTFPEGMGAGREKRPLAMGFAAQIRVYIQVIVVTQTVFRWK